MRLRQKRHRPTWGSIDAAPSSQIAGFWTEGGGGSSQSPNAHLAEKPEQSASELHQ